MGTIMKLLSLETATAAGGAALVIDGVVIGESMTTKDRRHAETLLPSAIELLAQAGITVQELDGIVIDVGPGLYTGLRVGIATARSLAMASGSGLYSLTSLEVLANDERLGTSQTVLSVLDARRGEVFAQYFTVENGQRFPQGEPRVLLPGDLIEEMDTRPQSLVVVGDGGVRYQELFAQLHGVEFAPVPLFPSPATAAMMVERGGVTKQDLPSDVTPIYLRDPDAVANFKVAAPSRLADS